MSLLLLLYLGTNVVALLSRESKCEEDPRILENNELPVLYNGSVPDSQRAMKMQFMVVGMDGSDNEALNRRLAARAGHIALGDKMRDAGKMLYGAAILDDGEKMVGSILICDFNSRQELDDWLREEPYVTGKVWENIEVKRCKVGPSFVGLTAQPGVP